MQSTHDFFATDELSLRILLVLRGSKHFSIHEISKTINQPMGDVWNRILLLERFGMITVEEEGYKLTKEGLSFLLSRGYHIPKAVEDKKSKKETDSFNIHPFGSFMEFLYWVAVPLTLIGLALTALVFLQMRDVGVVSVWVVGVILFVLLALYGMASFHKVPEYESLVIFRLGKCIGKRGPGPVLIIPLFDKPNTVDLRVRHQEVPHETCITQDNVQLDVDFVFYWKIQEPVWSITKVSDPDESIRLLATALLRAVIAHFKFNDVLNQRESINDLLKEKIDEISADWGVYVTTMEIREIKPPKEIVDSMHKQVSAEWQRKATVIQAEGEAQALRMLNEAAARMDEKTKSLKYYEMLRVLGQGTATKYILPIELMNLAQGLSNKNGDDNNVHVINPQGEGKGELPMGG
jgi:regulator of protease activity HflC (stomatin/prohibitin superfamily)